MPDDLTVAEKEHLEICFNRFKDEFYARFKMPAIGLATVFAIGVSLFASYLYIQAKINVMQVQTELVQARKDFYDDVMAANEQIEKMVNTYNKLATDAEVSVKRMASYEGTLEQIANNYTAMVGVEKLPPPPPLIEIPVNIPNQPPKMIEKAIPPPLDLSDKARQPGKDKEMFQIPQGYQQQSQ